MNGLSTIPYSPQAQLAHPRHDCSNLCKKICIIALVILGALIIATGILACLASQGRFAAIVGGVSKMSCVGAINSYAIMVTGGILVAISIYAWAHQHRHDHQPPQ